MNMRPHKATKLKRRKEPTAPRRRSSSVANLPGQLDSRTRELAEAREQQAATSEILRGISSSPTDVRPVFETIVRSAVRLCDGIIGAVNTFDGELTHVAAVHNYTPEALAAVRRMYPTRPGRQQLTGRAILSRTIVHVPDVLSDPEYAPDIALAGGWRGGLAVPMIRNEAVIGVILVTRAQVGPFSHEQIELLKTFADQAAIAIENVRLFKAEQQRTRELTESLEYRTATGDILRVISSSPTDVQPVFNTIAESAVRLCGGQFSFVLRFDGGQIHFAGCHGLSAEGLETFQRLLPRPAGEDTVSGRAILRRAVAQIPDVQADSAYGTLSLAEAVTYRSIAAVPLLRDGDPIGTIAVARVNTGLFPDRQISLLQTFADQAVIAIENVRLFDAEQQRTRELSEALDQQTATSEVLQVISRSAFDLHTVLDTLVASAARLCGTKHCMIFRHEDGFLRAAAAYNTPRELLELWERTPIPAGRGTATARALLERRPVHIPDVLRDPEYDFHEAQRLGAYRTVLAVPLLRDGMPLGTMVLWKTEVEPFTLKQIEVVTTFADQAVIAIENVRLFDAEQQRTRELTTSLQQQTATADVLKVISRSAFD